MKPTKMYVCTLIGLLILTLSSGTFSQGVSQPAPSSEAANPRFYEVAEKLDMGGSFYLYVDSKDAIRTLLKSIRDLIDKSGNVDQAQTFYTLADQLINSLGLYGVEDVGMSVVDLGERRRMKMFLRIPEDRQGLFKLLGGKPHEFKIVSFVPSDAVMFRCADFDLMETLTLARTVVQGHGGAADLAKFNMKLSELSSELGFDLETALQSLDGQLAFFLSLDTSRIIAIPLGNDQTMSVPTPAVAFMVRVKDDTLFNSLRTMLQKKEVDFEETATGDVKKLLLPPPESKQYKMTPLFASMGDYVFFATHNEYLDEIVETRKTGKNLSSNEEFKRLSQGLPSEGNGLIYVSTSLSNEIQRIFDTLTTQMKGGRRKSWVGVGLPTAPLLMLSTIGKEGGMVMVRVNEDTGVWVVAHTPMTGAQAAMMAATVPAFTTFAGIAIPNFLEAQTRSQVARVRADMRTLATALEAYHIDYNTYPPSPSFEVIAQEKPGSIATQKALSALTTPIAYITSIPLDPFNPVEGSIFGYYAPTLERDPELIKEAPPWTLWSMGPDSVSSIMSQEDLKSPRILKLTYDPTNGMKSSGDIVRIAQ